MKKIKIQSFDDPNFLKLGIICICVGILLFALSFRFHFPGIIALKGFGPGALICLMYFFARSKARRNQKLLLYFKGARLSTFGDLILPFAGIEFRLVRIASGGGASGVGGSYPVLWVYTKPTERLIVGHPQSKHYALGKFLFFPPYEVLNVDGASLLIGSDHKSSMELMRTELSKKEVLDRLVPLFQKDFAHLGVASEIHVDGTQIFKKRHVLRFIGLPEEIYENPQLLESRLQLIVECSSKIGIRIEKQT